MLLLYSKISNSVLTEDFKATFEKINFKTKIKLLINENNVENITSIKTIFYFFSCNRTS